MFFPVKMSRIRVYSITSKKDSLIDFLHKQGVLHIVRVNLPLERFEGFEWYKDVSTLAVKMRGLVSLFGLSMKGKFIKKVEPVSKVIQKAKKISSALEGIEEIAKRLKDIDEEKRELLKEYLSLKKYSRFYSNQVPESIELYAVEGKLEEVQSLSKELNSNKQKYSIVSLERRRMKDSAVLLVASSKPIAFVLEKYDVRYFVFPKEGLDKKIKEISEKISKLESEEKKLSGAIAKAKEKYSNELVYVLRQLEVYSDRANISDKFKSSNQFFVLEGWIPQNKLNSFSNALNKNFGSSVHLETVKTHEMPPTLLDNPRDVKPFERVVEMVSLPRGDQLDPTMLFALTIPLLYGMIIGDVFYSLMAMGFAYWLGKKFNKSRMAQMASKVWILSSLGGIVWGVIFDEWFGVSHYYWLSKLAEFGIGTVSSPLYQGFSRTHFIPLLMLASIVIGALHLIAGFLIGAYSEMRHSLKHAIGKIGFAMFIFDLLLLIPAIAGYLPLNLTILYGLLALSIILVFYGEGAIGLMELPTAIGNTMSYIRIAAVGLVGVILAELINDFFAPTPAAGLLNIFLLFILVLLHFFNAVIAMFEGIIQGGRLNLVEFGTKVYKGGGRKYKPFNLLQKYL